MVEKEFTRKGVCFNTGRTHFQKGHDPWNKGRGVNKECIICGKTFYVWNANVGRVKCCSKECGYKSRKKLFGDDNPSRRPEVREKISKVLICKEDNIDNLEALCNVCHTTKEMIWLKRKF
jgi:hypothetical protein